MTKCEFQVVLRNRFAALADPTPGSMEWWERVKAAMMADVLGYQKSPKESWISDHTWGLIAQRKLLLRKRQNESNSTSFYRDKIKKDREVKRSAQKDKRQWFNRQAQEAEDATARNDTKQVYCTTKKITGSTKARSGPIKAKYGSVISKERTN